MNAKLFVDALLAIFARKRDEVNLSVRDFLVMLADPYSAYSAGGGLGRARAASLRGLLFSFFNPIP